MTSVRCKGVSGRWDLVAGAAGHPGLCSLRVPIPEVRAGDRRRVALPLRFQHYNGRSTDMLKDEEDPILFVLHVLDHLEIWVDIRGGMGMTMVCGTGHLLRPSPFCVDDSGGRASGLR